MIGVAFGAEEFQVTFLVKIIVVSLLKLQRCVFCVNRHCHSSVQEIDNASGLLE